MDEPFAALDALTRERLQADLLRVAEETQVMLIFVTHSIEEAVLIGTRLHPLSSHPGRTIRTMTTEGTVLGQPSFAQLSQEAHELLFQGEEEDHV
ncbi:NitT/TauT family transport system ATP-binding protein [Paracoccus chinensis]|uniref:NitT/TauT family transport system ATP-binding protein n=2 Tax=Paracoccus chinensis TaxID=525640 RepID=A0A1G9JXF0_9RHOB|nr:NitT/TauT family transport system ATP-binding protein [Paracoccus chinensis]